MARATKAAATTPPQPAAAPIRAKRRAAADQAPLALAPVKAKKLRSNPAPVSAAKAKSDPGKPAAIATPAAAPTRVPPPSKGELRAHIEKLEAANTTLKAKAREANRNAKAAARRIAELEKQVSQFQAEAANAVDPAAVMDELEAAKAALQAKGRDASRAAKLAERRIIELEAQVEHLQGEAAKIAPPVAQQGEAKRSRRGRPPGRKNAIDPSDAVSSAVVAEPEPVDTEAQATRNVSEENLPEVQVHEDE